MSESDPVISVKNVDKVFNQGSPNAVTALTGIDLDIRHGEFVSFIGPSGCGKSTLLRVIADLTKPTGGQVSVNGKTPEQARLNREYGFIFQAATLYEWRTITKNVQLPLEIMGYSESERQERSSGCWKW